MDSHPPALRELPLLLGLALGGFLLWYLGGAFALDGRVGGYAWVDYLNNAWAVHQGDPARFDAFRKPLHGALVALVGGPLDSYVNGAILISSLAAWIMLLSTALAGRALGGPWVGGIAAAAMPMAKHAAAAARYANSYPLLGAATGLCLAAGLAAVRWPRWSTALLLGLAGGLAVATDVRGAVALPLVLLGAVGMAVRSGRRVGIARLVLVGMLVGGGTRVAPLLGQTHHFSIEEQARIQESVVERFQGFTHDAALLSACAGQAPPGIRALLEPCAWQTIRWNAAEASLRHLPFGLGLSLLGLALLLLPARRARLDTLLGGMVLVGGVGPLVALMGLTPMVDRYWTQHVVLLSLLAPLGIARLVGWLPERLGRWILPSAMVGLLVVAWRTDPTQRGMPSTLEMHGHKASDAAVVLGVAARIGPDDPFYDCSAHHVSHGLLPHHVPAQGLPEFPTPRGGRCLDWVQFPPTRSGLPVWVGLDPSLALEYTPAGAPAYAFQLNDISRWGWTLVWETEGFALWRHD